MYTPIIGLEVHAELATKSKMFCTCKIATDTDNPNTAICPTCTGHPGTLPLPNKEAIRMVAMLGEALSGTVREVSKFDRKHYFYPDLPKGYQISQFDEPIAEHGKLILSFAPGENMREEAHISIRRAHLEEDTAKLIHSGENTLVDFNRSGVPLVEIVTGADIATALEAKTYCQELQRILRVLHISEADMEKGHMRCEANVSVQRAGSYDIVHGEVHPRTGETLNAKVEVKNINSFRALERAIAYEINRQTAMIERGESWGSETRGWNEDKGETVPQRKKETAADYRYFPEPDIPPFFPKKLIESIRLPELPQQKRARFIREYGFSFSDALFFTETEAWSNFAEEVMSEFASWLGNKNANSSADIENLHPAKIAGGWMSSKLQGLLSSRKKTISDISFSAEHFAELLGLVYSKRLSGAQALTMLEEMVDGQVDKSIESIISERGLEQVHDENALEALVQEVLAEYPEQTASYKAGKLPLLQFLKGMVIKKSGGSAHPQTVEMLLKKILN